MKTFSVFPYSYRNTSGSLGEREIEVGICTISPNGECFHYNFKFFQTFTSVSITQW